jgi:hypothetical protein
METLVGTTVTKDSRRGKQNASSNDGMQTFFINKINSEKCKRVSHLYCEINVSSVSPFPKCAIPYIADEVRKSINHNNQ